MKAKRKPWVNWLLFFTTLVIVFLLGLLASSIVERRAEAVFVNKPVVRLADYEPRNAEWGKNFPREFESYTRTSDTSFRTLYNGNTLVDMLGEYPQLVVLWAGYAFSLDYKQGRGHYYAISDMYHTLRTGAPTGPDDGPMPNTCWTCKSPDVPRVMNEVGVAAFYSGAWASRGPDVVNPIGCADCHDPNTMDLRITRPALIEAWESTGRDITKSTHQEMRSLVCAQCHVEYYFNKKFPVEGVNYLTFPWKDGTGPEAMLEYYDRMGFSDWTHAISKAPMLKAQHPDYEVFTTGIHFERGVACADCHMPYHSEGGQKFTNHHMTSPLMYITSSCQVCHRESEETLRNNVYDRQRKVAEIRGIAEELIVRAHVEAGLAWELGAAQAEMEAILYDIRVAQWYWDYVAASHGASFHSPVESSRTIGKSIDHAQQARVALARLLASYGQLDEVPYPDISTKEKAQAFIGAPVDKLKADKSVFLETIVPAWLEEAARREATYGQPED